MQTTIPGARADEKSARRRMKEERKRRRRTENLLPVELCSHEQPTEEHAARDRPRVEQLARQQVREPIRLDDQKVAFDIARSEEGVSEEASAWSGPGSTIERRANDD
jgi:hypothetical protein